jgi:hypothetical protein
MKVELAPIGGFQRLHVVMAAPIMVRTTDSSTVNLLLVTLSVSIVARRTIVGKWSGWTACAITEVFQQR